METSQVTIDKNTELNNKLVLENKKKIHSRVPWIEKYRPRTIDDLILDKKMLNKIKKIIDEKDMPNIIITGVPGIGKTTTIKCIARGLYGKYVHDAVLELNASDDRGIKVQDTIMNFCKKKLNLNEDTTEGGTKTKDKPTNLYSDHKLIILDEADNMTAKAQPQINLLMEKYHKTTRFAFTCNSSEDILESIQSRCIILKYMRLTQDQITGRLLQICDIEQVTYETPAIESLAFIAQGDIRAAINNLQKVFIGKGEITNEAVYEICEMPQPVIIKKIFAECKQKNFVGAVEGILNLKNSGFSESDISLSMINVLKMRDVELDEPTKINFLMAISNTAYVITKGLDNSLQLVACIANMILNS